MQHPEAPPHNHETPPKARSFDGRLAALCLLARTTDPNESATLVAQVESPRPPLYPAGVDLLKDLSGPEGEDFERCVQSWIDIDLWKADLLTFMVRHDAAHAEGAARLGERLLGFALDQVPWLADNPVGPCRSFLDALWLHDRGLSGGVIDGKVIDEPSTVRDRHGEISGDFIQRSYGWLGVKDPALVAWLSAHHQKRAGTNQDALNGEHDPRLAALLLSAIRIADAADIGAHRTYLPRNMSRPGDMFRIQQQVLAHYSHIALTESAQLVGRSTNGAALEAVLVSFRDQLTQLVLAEDLDEGKFKTRVKALVMTTSTAIEGHAGIDYSGSAKMALAEVETFVDQPFFVRQHAAVRLVDFVIADSQVTPIVWLRDDASEDAVRDVDDYIWSELEYQFDAEPTIGAFMATLGLDFAHAKKGEPAAVMP